jgi:PKD repeat protein
VVALRVDGSLTGANVSLGSGGLLSGAGTGGGAVTVTSFGSRGVQASGSIGDFTNQSFPGYGYATTVDPAGPSATGVLQTGGFTLESGTLAVELDGGTPGTGYDQVQASGPVGISGTTLQVTLDYTPAVGQSLTLIANGSGSPVTGTFTGLPEGALLVVGNVVFQVSYQGGTGNDVTLTVVGLATPTLNIPSQTGQEGQAVNLTLQNYTNDAQGGPLTFSMTGTLPAGLSFNPTHGVITGTLTDGGPENSPYSITVTATDGQNTSSPQTFTWTVQDASLAAGSLSVASGTEGVSSSSLSASFTDAFTGAAASDFTATIAWGDGSTSLGTVTGSNGSYSINASHQYAEEGSCAVSVSIADAGGSTASLSTTATVADAALTAGTASVTASSEGVSSSSLSASFTDANTAAPAGDFTATINWGDNTTSTRVVTGSGGTYSVSGGHQYAEEGTYTVSVSVADVGGSSASLSTTAAVADVALSATAQTVTATEGASFTGVVATFADSNPNGTSADYSAVITWDDGSTSAGTIGSSGGYFTVTRTHTFAEEGSRPISVTISDQAASATAASSADVLDAALTVTAQTVSAAEGASFTGVVATFTDADPNGTVADYSATITWPDGTTSAGTVGSTGGVFTVAGTHTFADEGSYPVSVAVTDNEGSSFTADAWATAAGMPTAREGLAAVTGPDGRIYALGGYNGAPLNTVEAYDPATNTWAAVAPMLNARYGLAAVAGPDGRIYALGGYNNNAGVLNTVEAYNPATNTWTAVAPMPTARYLLAAVTGLDGRIYALGGSDGASYLNTVEAYNPATNTWTTLGGMPTAREGLAAVAGPDGRIYALGGYNGGHVNTVEAYDPAAETWTTLAGIPTARSSLAAAVGPDGRVYALGGDNGASVLSTVEAYSPATNAWTATASMPTARNGLAAAVTPDGRIYALGGADTSGTLNVLEVLSLGRSTATASSTANVGDGALTAGTVTAGSGVEGVTATSLSATFSDANTAAPAGDSTATINWGDNTTSTGVVTGSGGSYSVSGSHQYAEEGNYTVSVSVADIGGQTASLSTTASVADAALTAGTATATASTEGVSSSSLTATLTDANTAAPAGDFTATIHWGDGNTTSGTVSYNSTTGVYSVTGSYIYAEEGRYRVTVDVTDKGGSSLTGIGKTIVQVADAALSSTAANLTPPAVVEGQPLSKATVFHFTDADPAGTAGDYTAVVTLGDGNQVTLTATPGPNGQIVANPGGGFDVQLSYTYAGLLSNQTFSVSVSDAGGASTAQSATFNVLAVAQQGTTLLVGGGTGNDAYMLAPGSTAGTVVVKDNGTSLGTFTVAQVLVYGGGGSNRITVNGRSSGTAFMVGATAVGIPGVSISGNAIGAWAVNALGGANTFAINGSGLHAVLTGGPKVDTFTVAAGVNFDGAIHGGNGIETLVGQSLSTGGSNWVLTGVNSGTLNGAPFTAIDNLSGGAGSDSFKFAPSGSLHGKIVGGGGSDWLDYSAWASGVNVNLVKGTATAVTGGVSGIANVRGGTGSDTLTGGGGNILVGGGGHDTLTDTYTGSAANRRSLLIAGAGGSTLKAGGAGDILIGGTTTYDNNNAALMAILAEWQSGDDYTTRFNRLEGLQGGGLNGAYDLIWGGTVNDNNAKDRLVGGTTGLDWFFAQLSGINLDTIVNLNKPGHEHVNNTL